MRVEPDQAVIELAQPLVLSGDEEAALQKAHPLLSDLLKTVLRAGLQALAREPDRYRAAQERMRAGWATSVTVLSVAERDGLRISCWQHSPADDERVEVFQITLGEGGSTQPPAQHAPGTLN